MRGILAAASFLALGHLVSWAQQSGEPSNPSSVFDLLDALTPPVFNLELYDEKGNRIHLLSGEAYRHEFRYLKRQLHEIDLKAPGVETDGWTYNIAEAEWPMMAACYYAYGCAELAMKDPSMRDEALGEMRWVIEALQTPRLSGFMRNHFGEPFGQGEINPSVFLHGHFLNVAMRYREVSGDTRYDALIQRVAQSFINAYRNEDQGILRSYRDMWWISDNLPALSALSRYDRVFGKDTSDIRKKYVRSVKDHYLDKNNGMICTYVYPAEHMQRQGARGISVMYGLHFLKDVDPEFATAQYELAKKHLLRKSHGLAAVREFPEGSKENPDIDSGPVIMGLGPSASGFGIAAAAILGDDDSAQALMEASVIAGLPTLLKGEIHYTTMPTVGQAVIFFGKTVTLRSVESEKK